MATAEDHSGFLNPAPPRRRAESTFVRVISTNGIIGIGTALAVLLAHFAAASWIIGLTVSVLTVVLAAVLWRSREL
jgi:hypothetical protein